MINDSAAKEFVDGRFELTRELGYGSYGHVYAALEHGVDSTGDERFNGGDGLSSKGDTSTGDNNSKGDNSTDERFSGDSYTSDDCECHEGHSKRAADVESDCQVAVKLHTNEMLLNREIKIYNYMWKYKREGVGEDLRVPRLLWEGTHKERRALVMSRLGPSLDKLYDRASRPWTMPTVCRVAAECLTLLKEVHHLGIVHRDIKPDNFAIGHGANAARIYIFDFGLSSQFISANGKHVPERTGLSLIGTMRYASPHTHAGHLQSRRDDLISLFYMLLYFATGSLPWRHLTERNVPDRADRNARIRESKERLAQGAHAVDALLKGFGDAVHKLEYEDSFVYDKWIGHFNENACSMLHADWQLERKQGIKRCSKTLRNRRNAS